jgi:hypothetical protein
MKSPRNLGLVAVVVFVISHFLPAYGDGSGFACFGVCWNILWGHDAEILKIKIGFYTWLIAYGLLVAAHFWKEAAESVGSVPLARSVT